MNFELVIKRCCIVCVISSRAWRHWWFRPKIKLLSLKWTVILCLKRNFVEFALKVERKFIIMNEINLIFLYCDLFLDAAWQSKMLLNILRFAVASSYSAYANNRRRIRWCNGMSTNLHQIKHRLTPNLLLLTNNSYKIIVLNLFMYILIHLRRFDWELLNRFKMLKFGQISLNNREAYFIIISNFCWPIFEFILRVYIN